MAKVKIQGNASGTGVLTVTAPNTDTDRTITLPDADVTLGTDATKLPLAGGAMTGNVTHADNVRAQFGAGNDLEIYHDGTDSYIHDSGSGNLELRTNGVQIGIMAINGSEYMGKFVQGNQVELYYNNSKKIETTATGIAVSGGVAIGGTGAANTLDDYEEGTHTTSAGVGSGSITLNSTNNKFYYTKIGRQVTITGRIDVDSVSSPTGDIYFTLPFASSAAGGSQNSSSAGGLFVWNPTSGDSGLWVTWLDSGGSNVYFRYGSGNQASPAANLVQAATEFRIGLTYMT